MAIVPISVWATYVNDRDSKKNKLILLSWEGFKGEEGGKVMVMCRVVLAWNSNNDVISYFKSISLYTFPLSLFLWENADDDES